MLVKATQELQMSFEYHMPYKLVIKPNQISSWISEFMYVCSVYFNKKLFTIKGV